MTELFHGTWWDQQQGKTFDELSPGRFTKLFNGLGPTAYETLVRLAGRSGGQP